MTSKRLWLLVGACIVLAAVWYWFRPDRLFTNKKVNEAAPSATLSQSDQPLYTGRFEGKLHKTSGRASVFSISNGDRSLQLTDFTTSDGPELHVVLVSSSRTSSDEDFGLDATTSIDLGGLKRTTGNQSYPIPKGTDLSHYDVVSIYSERFRANFGLARLEPF